MPAKQFTTFISYSHADAELLAVQLKQRINDDERGKAITFWQDHSQMKYGQWSKQIEEAIDSVEFLIMLITPGALASRNCKDEWMYARKRGVAVLPVNGNPDDPGFYNSFPNWLKKQHIYHTEKNWERFINDLNSRPETPKVPLMAPRLSEVTNYVKRPEKLQRLKKLLLVGDEPVSITTALQGSGGFGKTTLAIALCNDDDIIQTFDDGILWVTLGQQKGIALIAMQKLYDAVSNDNKRFIDIEQAQLLLSEKLSSKNYLLVLDDVWHRIDAENILKAAGKCTILITTRMDRLLSNAKQEHVDEMTKEEAIEQLSNYTETGNVAHDSLGDLAEKLGNWTLLLRLAGAQLKARTDEGETIEQAITYVNKRLDRKGLLGFDKADAEQRNDSVQICLAASIDQLNNTEKEKLYSLGIFPEDEKTPFGILEKYWKLDDFDCEELVEKFHRYGLLDIDLPDRSIKIHDILLKYYGTCLANKPAWHLLLVKNNGNFDTWTSNYMWYWCVWHLAEADAYNDSFVLLSNYYWIAGKLKATGNLYEIVWDYQYKIAPDEIMLIRKALLLSAAVIADDPSQLPEQLYGRLETIQTGLCKQLADEALKAISEKEIALLPLNPALEVPGLHNLVFRGHSSNVSGALVKDDLLISWSGDYTLRSWDILSGKSKLIFEGHVASVDGTLLHGDILISWDHSGILRLWDIFSGKTHYVLEGHTSYVYGVLIQDDTLISWSSDGTLRSWDMLSAKSKHIFQGHSGRVFGALIKQDTLISWSEDSTLRSWDILSGKSKLAFEGHLDSVYGALIEGDTLISWSKDYTLRSWNIISGKSKHVFEGHSEFVRDALVYGNTLISWSGDGTLRSWDIFSGKHKHVFEGHLNSIYGTLIESNTLISWSFDGMLRSWDILSGTCKQVFGGHLDSVKGALIHGDILISWSNDHTLRSWDIISGESKQVFEGHISSVEGALIHNNTLITWSGKTLRSYDIFLGKSKDVFEGHSSAVTGLMIHGNTLISWSDDHTLRSWDILSYKGIHVFEGHSSFVEGALIEGNTLVSWSNDRTLRSWDTMSGASEFVFTGHSESIYGALIYGDMLISWSDDHTLRSWNILSGKSGHVFEGHSKDVFGALMYGDIMISWSYDGTLRSWDTLSGKIKKVFEGHISAVRGALICGDTLISWSDDATLRSWDILSGKIKHIFEGHLYDVSDALIHGDTLISCSRDGTLRSWDILSSKSLQVFEGHTSDIYKLNRQGNNLLGWNSHELVLWDFSSATVINKFDLSSKEFQVHGNYLYLIDQTNTLHIFQFPSGEYVFHYTVDAGITSLQLANHINRIILGDASGRLHFLQPIGFEL